MTCGAVGAVRSKAAAHPVAGSCIFDPSLLLGDQALHELGPFLFTTVAKRRACAQVEASSEQKARPRDSPTRGQADIG